MTLTKFSILFLFQKNKRACFSQTGTDQNIEEVRTEDERWWNNISVTLPDIVTVRQSPDMEGGGGAAKCDDDNPTVTIVHKYVSGFTIKINLLIEY